MARADLLIDIVKAGAEGDQALFQKALEALITEERSKQHNILADRLAEHLNLNGKPMRPTRPTAAVLNGEAKLFHEIRPRRGFGDLLLPPLVQQACSELVEEHNRVDLLRAHNLEPRNRVLLVGPPGNGKTSLAEALAQELGNPMLVVCDMLLTGFDAPVEQVMYLDSSLREHTLLQAIARVNRTADNKDFGLVVDYWGVAHHLEQALAIFSPSDVQGAMKPRTSELPQLESRHRRVMRFFQRVDHSDLEACLKVLEPEDVRAEFEMAFRRFSQSLDMLLPDPSALPFVDDLKWLGKVRNAARVRFRDDQFDLTGCRAKVRALIEQHITTTDVQGLVEPISILAAEFEEEVKKLGSDEARASEMEHAIRHEINVRMDENPVVFQSLSETLERIIQQRREEQITAAEQLSLLTHIVLDIRDIPARADELGLSEPGYAIFEVFAQAAVDGEAPDDLLPEMARRDLARDVLESLEGLTVVDWHLKDDVQRRMRMAVKKRLKAAGFGRAAIEPMTAKILDLARVQLVKR